MLINGREITVGIDSDEPTTDDLAQINSRRTMAQMPNATAARWTASARTLRDGRNDGWNPYLGLIK